MAQVQSLRSVYHLQLTGTTIVEPSPRWVRVKYNGEAIADSKHVLYVHEPNGLGDYFFPREDVRTDFLKQSSHGRNSPTLGAAQYWDLQVKNEVSQGAAWVYTDPQPDEYPDLRGYIAFHWNKVDHWYEENEEVFVHPRNPYHRVDVLESTRHVRIIIGGELVVDTHHPFLLVETGLPTRYYIRPEDVQLSYFEPSDTVTRCPYKGQASYLSFNYQAKRNKDVVWIYQDPIAENPRIKGLIAFFNERVDAIYVDDVLQPVPQTHWSR